MFRPTLLPVSYHASSSFNLTEIERLTCINPAGYEPRLLIFKNTDLRIIFPEHEPRHASFQPIANAPIPYFTHHLQYVARKGGAVHKRPNFEGSSHELAIWLSIGPTTYVVYGTFQHSRRMGFLAALMDRIGSRFFRQTLELGAARFRALRALR